VFEITKIRSRIARSIAVAVVNYDRKTILEMKNISTAMKRNTTISDRYNSHIFIILSKLLRAALKKSKEKKVASFRLFNMI